MLYSQINIDKNRREEGKLFPTFFFFLQKSIDRSAVKRYTGYKLKEYYMKREIERFPRKAVVNEETYSSG